MSVVAARRFPRVLSRQMDLFVRVWSCSTQLTTIQLCDNTETVLGSRGIPQVHGRRKVLAGTNCNEQSVPSTEQSPSIDNAALDNQRVEGGARWARACSPCHCRARLRIYRTGHPTLQQRHRSIHQVGSGLSNLCLMAFCTPRPHPQSRPLVW